MKKLLFLFLLHGQDRADQGRVQHHDHRDGGNGDPCDEEGMKKGSAEYRECLFLLTVEEHPFHCKRFDGPGNHDDGRHAENGDQGNGVQGRMAGGEENGEEVARFRQDRDFLYLTGIRSTRLTKISARSACRSGVSWP